MSMIVSTYALGSCIGLVAYDSVAHAGGILHMMLPDSTISPDKAAAQPAMFADTGLPLFFRSLQGVKAEARRTKLLITGGAAVLSGEDSFKIGDRNARATTAFLQRYGFSANYVEIGGTVNRTVHLHLSTGRVVLKLPQGETEISLA